MLIALLGNAGSGKDTVGRMIKECDPDARTIALADPLKEFCQEVFAFTDEQLWGPSEERNKPDPRYVRMRRGCLGGTIVGFDDMGKAVVEDSPKEDVYLTPRYALQTLGTEWGRDCYSDVWIEYGIRKAQRMLSAWDDHVRSGGSMASSMMASKVVITDCRFLNEAEKVREAGGLVWRIQRPQANADAVAKAGVAGHASEMEQLDPRMDALVTHDIINNSTLENLRTIVEVLLRR